MKKLVSILLLTLLSSLANAKTIWSDYSLTYLNGSNYQVGDSDKQVVTFEYATGTSWGGAFMFFDRLKSDNGDEETYGEFSARYKILDWKRGFIKSAYVIPHVEMGDGFTNYLYGFGFDLAMPGFKFFQTNFFRRNNDDGDDSYQTTIVWGIPIGPLYYDGFIDYATDKDNSLTGDKVAHMNFTSQLKYDIAPILGWSSKAYIGIEYNYWNNKFGIDGVDERNVNFLFKYHF